MLSAKIAFRNLFRQKRRSILTGATMVVGYLLCSVSVGISDGTYRNIINLFTRNHTGHIQIHAAGYLDKPTLYDTVNDWEAVGRQIDALRYVVAWAPRVQSPTLAFSESDKTSGAQVIGIDSEREAATTTLKNKIAEGRYFKTADKTANVALIGDGLARILRVGVGDEIVLVGQGADGSVANDVFSIVGTLKESGERSVYLPLATAQGFLALDNRIHEIAITLSRYELSERVAATLRRRLNNPNLDVQPWQVVESQFYQAMTADLKGNNVTFGIIVFVVGLTVLNTVLMTVMERTREYAVMRALGTRPVNVFRLVVLEAALLAILSVVVGAGLSAIANALLARYGIGMPPVEWGGMTLSRITSAITFASFWIPAVLTLIAAVGATLFPASRAARMQPAKGLRAT